MKPKKAGRPPLEGGKKSTHTIHLTRKHLMTAKKLGDGNISAGVRMALDVAAMQTWSDK